MIRTLQAVAVTCFFLLLSALALGQGGAATGDLHVTVKDAKGAAVADATVMVRDVAKGVERTATSDGQGGYSVRLLPPGTYSVTVEAARFTKVESTGVSITVGGLVDLPVTLSVSGGKEVVEVTSQADLVETSRSSTTDTIGQRRIDNLPINGRNYINFTLTDSQVVRDNAPTLGAAPTSGLNMSGQRGRSNLVNVDGADATDNSVNGVRSTVSQEAVQEFQIITNSYSAEYGRASGGVVNIITRSGSNAFHGDVYGYLRNRDFQAVNPFSTVSNPAYTRVQAGAAFGGALKKDKTFYYFSYEITRRHETGFSSIAPASNIGYYGLQNFDTSTTAGGLIPLPFGTIPITSGQVQFLQPGGTLDQIAASQPAVFALIAPQVPNYVFLLGASEGMALNGVWPTSLTGIPGLSGFATTCSAPPCFVPASYQSIGSQVGNFPVFEGTSLYSLRLDHNINNSQHLSLRFNVSPSTTTGLEGSGEDQPFGQNAYSRTSEQTYRDVTGVLQHTWTLGTNKVNEFRFQYARRGLSYFYNTATTAGSAPAVNIPGYGYLGREPYSYIQRVEQRYQFTDNFSWTLGRHDTKFGVDVNYLPLSATFTVNYGGNYDFGNFPAFPSPFPVLNAVQAYGAGLPNDFVQGLGSPSDSFHNIPIGAFWQDSWRVRPSVTLNFGLRYDVEIPPTFKPVTPLGQAGYNILGLQKGIKTDKNNIQPRIGVAWDPHGDGKTVVRASYGIFYDHPLLGLYFLGNASDGSSSGQLAFPGTGVCTGSVNPANLNAIPIFQGLVNAAGCTPGPPALLPALGYLPNQQQFTSLNFPNSLFLNQNYLTDGFPLFFQPFGYPQSKRFVFAYSQQTNLTVERDLGHGFALSLAYNFNGGRHLNRPINSNTQRGDMLVTNYNAALSDPTSYATTGGPLGVGAGSPTAGYAPCGVNSSGQPWVQAALMSFFRPGGINPSIANFLTGLGAGACVTTFAPAVLQFMQASGISTAGFNTACNPATFASCVPFGDMDANYSNGSSIYHGFSANLRKRFTDHYEFLASYTWSHSIDDSTDLQSTLTPQDSFYPGNDRSTSLFDQRHRFVFSGVYQTGKMGGSFGRKFFSDWTLAPIIEVSSGRPFNIVTGSGDNLQESSLTGRPNTFVNPACTALGYQPVNSKYSPTGVLQEPCIANFNGTLLSLDGNLGRNAGITPWRVFDDMRVSKRINFSERFNLDLIADMFNIANKYNVASVSPLYTNAGQATAAYDPRQFQFAMKLNW
jgi:hypothetical protein